MPKQYCEIVIRLAVEPERVGQPDDQTEESIRRLRRDDGIKKWITHHIEAHYALRVQGGNTNVLIDVE